MRLVGKGRVFISISSRVLRLQKQQYFKEWVVSFAFFKYASLIDSMKKDLANSSAFLCDCCRVSMYLISDLAVLVSTEVLMKSQFKLVK